MIMRYAAIIFLSLVAITLNAQSAWRPKAVYLQLMANGKIKVITADNGIYCPAFPPDCSGEILKSQIITASATGHDDTSEMRSMGYSGTYDYMLASLQFPLNLGTIYPGGQDALPFYPKESKDTVLFRSLGEFSEAWHFNKEHTRVTKVIAGKGEHYSTWTYSYHPDGRLNSVTLYTPWEPDYLPNTFTKEFVYDDKNRCTAVCTHTGNAMPDLQAAVSYWKKQLDSASRVEPYSTPALHSYQGVALNELLIYSYSGNKLQTGIAYSYEASCTYDSLFYNEKGQLVTFRSSHHNFVNEITFTYDKKGRISTQTENEWAYHRHEYDKQGRISKSYYEDKDEMTPQKFTVLYFYLRKE